MQDMQDFQKSTTFWQANEDKTLLVPRINYLAKGRKNFHGFQDKITRKCFGRCI